MPGAAPKHDRVIAALGVTLAILLVFVVRMLAPRITDPQLLTLLSYLAVWVPLTGAVLVAAFRRVQFLGTLGLRFRPIDLLWGVGVGLLARVVAGLLEIAFYGRPASGSPAFGDTSYDGWWLFAVLLAPVLLAPLIEELYFRGLLLRSMLEPGRAGAAVAIVASAVIFALVHLLQGGSTAGLFVVGLSTLVLGLANGVLAVQTGRLGGAIIAHVTSNALVVVPALL